MTAPQTMAYPGSESARRFHSTPASPPIAAPVRTRLMVQALGDEVKDHKRGRETGNADCQELERAGIEDRLFCVHAPPYGRFLRVAQDG